MLIVKVTQSPFLNKKIILITTMKQRVLIVLVYIFYFTDVFAQSQNQFLMEIIVSDTLGNTISGVGIYGEDNYIKGVTDKNGISTFLANNDDIFYLSHIGFERMQIKITEDSYLKREDGSCMMAVIMQQRTIILPEVVITEQAPQHAYKNEEVWVSDYNIDKNGIFMILDRPSEHVLLYLSHEQDTLARLKVKSKFDKLYQDAFGNTHLLCSDSAYQIVYDEVGMKLSFGVSMKTLHETLVPVKIITDSIMVLQQYMNRDQQVIYMSVNRNNKKITMLANLYGSTLEMARDHDSYRKEIQRMKDNNTRSSMFFDPRSDFEEETRDFQRELLDRLFFKPIYCPAILSNDSIFIFDFQNNTLFKFTNTGESAGECDITFHETGYFKKLLINNPWDENIIVDKSTGTCYAQFSTDGIVTLKEINTRTGKIVSETKLDYHSFPENIQIYDGFVYYIFRNDKNTAKNNRRNLYKMNIR